VCRSAWYVHSIGLALTSLQGARVVFESEETMLKPLALLVAPPPATAPTLCSSTSTSHDCCCCVCAATLQVIPLTVVDTRKEVDEVGHGGGEGVQAGVE